MSTDTPLSRAGSLPQGCVVFCMCGRLTDRRGHTRHGNALLRLRYIVDMLLTATTNKLKLHQIDLASFRRESGFERTAAISIPDSPTLRITRHLERLIGIGLYFQLNEIGDRPRLNRKSTALLSGKTWSVPVYPMADKNVVCPRTSYILL